MQNAFVSRCAAPTSTYRPRHPDELCRRTCGMGREHPTDRVSRNRLAERHLNGCMDVRDPHRPSMISEHTNDCITDPAWTTRS